jgi:hypothetical protein
MDIINAIMDLRDDIKKVLNLLEEVNLAEAVSAIREFNRNMEGINLKETMRTIKQLNLLLSQVDFRTLNNLSLAFNQTDIKDIVNGIKMLQGLVTELANSEPVERGRSQ